MAAEQGLIIVGTIVMGILIGILEIIFVKEDEGGMKGALGHGLHAVPIALVLTFAAMNISFVASLFKFNLQANIMLEAGIRVIIGIFAMVKVKAAAMAIKGYKGNAPGFSENIVHALIIGALIAVSPYIWAFIIGTNILPAWIPH